MVKCHPDSLEEVKRVFESLYPKDCVHFSGDGLIFELDLGLPKRKYNRKYIFPEERFVEYGPEDVNFLNFAGLLKEEVVDSGPFYETEFEKPKYTTYRIKERK